MKEVLSLQYEAGADAFVVCVSTVKESEHVPGALVRQLGVPQPTARVLLGELPPEHGDAFRALLAALVPLAEKRYAEVIADPLELAAAAARLAQEEQRAAARRLAATEEEARLDAAIAKRREELAALK